MKKKIGLVCLAYLILAVSNFCENAFAYNNHGYPYNTTVGCMSNSCPVDDLGFYQNNCTSYAAYILKKIYGVPFHNDGWSHGGNWKNAAEKKGIKVDSYPLPGDVAWWKYNWTGDSSNEGDDYGHVAFVEKVHYDSNGNATGIKVSEYNYSPECGLSNRSKDEQEIKV